MNNVKSVVNCPHCGSLGDIRRKEDKLLVLECDPCNYRWKTYSKTCKDCGKPNGYFVEGPCMKCYSLKHNAI